MIFHKVSIMPLGINLAVGTVTIINLLATAQKNELTGKIEH